VIAVTQLAMNQQLTVAMGALAKPEREIDHCRRNLAS
jgi:hypothetical protein